MASKEIIAFGGLEVSFCLDEDDTNGQLTMFEVVVNTGAKVPCPITTKTLMNACICWKVW